MHSKVYVNRTLNLKRIRCIGLDMDHTLIRYNSENFEKLSHSTMVDKLVKTKGYPESLRSLKFDYSLAIRGLVVDRKQGNLLKVNRYSAIRASHNGLDPIDFKTQQKLYKSIYIDLAEKDYLAVDTTFSLSLAVLFSQIVDLKKKDRNSSFPEFAIIADDVLGVLDEAHRDGSIKDHVRKNLADYVIKDERVVQGLERYKNHGKKLFVLTNSDFHYTKLLLDYAINPFLKKHKNWSELFDFTITLAQKPKFFIGKDRYLKVNAADGSMTNYDSKLAPGIYQGGNARTFTEDLNLEGDEILYVGDHIYGDILRLKKDCNWRTAMVIEELDSEIVNNQKSEQITHDIEALMKTKEPLEDQMTEIMTKKVEANVDADESVVGPLQKKISEIDTQISQLIKKQMSYYNPSWGPLMRAGNEESYFAHQVDRFACVYMTKLSDLLDHSPRTYFRAHRRLLAHEMVY